MTSTYTLAGIRAVPVTIGVTMTERSGVSIMGMTDVDARETRVRVRASLARLGVDVASLSVTVIADPPVTSDAAALDLPIACAVLEALGAVPPEALRGTVMLGGLSLTGAVRPIRGLLPRLIGAREAGMRRAIVPAGNAREAGAVSGIEVFVAEHLEQVRDHVRGKALLSTAAARAYEASDEAAFDLGDVKGQHAARRALEIAAAGGHHLLMLGPPGGKTMLARRMPSILPPLTFDEAIEASVVHSVDGILPADSGIVRSRPFRAPHYTVSEAGLVGGGDPPRAGEVSLAHHGVLFLDDLAEFRRSTLEQLRAPLHDGSVTVGPNRARATFPARPMLVAAMNPCPCGYAGEGSGRCRCTVDAVTRYRDRALGALGDLIDARVRIEPTSPSALAAAPPGEPSSAVRERVVAARARQAARQDGQLNGRLDQADFERVAPLDEPSTRMLAIAAEARALDASAIVRVRRVARTIADLDGVEHVRAEHVAESLALAAPVLL
jgi:magnesium chelatase family protein